jgi:hypothetical protein
MRIRVSFGMIDLLVTGDLQITTIVGGSALSRSDIGKARFSGSSRTTLFDVRRPHFGGWGTADE